MPTLMNHSHYWQIAPTPGAVDPEILQQYPSWQSTVLALLVVLLIG
jgi:hypothetical protein